MPSPVLSVKSLDSNDSEYRDSSFFAKTKKEYINFLKNFVTSKKPGIIHKKFVNELINTKKSDLIKKKNQVKDLMMQNCKALKNEKYREIMIQVLNKLHNADKIVKGYNMLIFLITLNYVIYNTNSPTKDGIWNNPNGRKAEAEFFKSFEKFFTPDQEDEDNEDEIMSNFHEILLHITEKYKLKLHKDDKEHNKFYKTLLLMHRYPVNTSDVETIHDFVNMTDKKMTLEKYLKKNDNIIIQVRGEYLRDKDANGNTIKLPMYVFTTRSNLKGLLRNESKTFYGCKERQESFVPRESNLDKSIKYIDNKDVEVKANKFWDISIINDFPHQQLFVLQNLEETFPSYTSIYLANSDGTENVVSGWHCQHDAPKGTAKLLLGVADSEIRPSSMSPHISSPSISPLTPMSAQTTPVNPELLSENVTVRRRRNNNSEPRTQTAVNDTDALETYEGHIFRVNALAILDSKTFISGSDDKTIKLWKKDKTSPERTYEGHTKTIRALAILDSQTFISGSWDYTIKLWKKDKTSAERTYKGHTGSVYALAMLDSQTFISGSSDRTIKLWRRDSVTPLSTYKGHTDFVEVLAVLDSQTFISGSWDTTIKLWKIDKTTALRTYVGHTNEVYALAMLDSQTFISGSWDYTIKLWNIDNDTPLTTYEGHTDFLLTLAMLDSQTFISGSKDNTIKLWNIHNGNALHTFEGHTGLVRALATMDSQTFISGSADKTIKRWKLPQSLIARNSPSPRFPPQTPSGTPPDPEPEPGRSITLEEHLQLTPRQLLARRDARRATNRPSRANNTTRRNVGEDCDFNYQCNTGACIENTINRTKKCKGTGNNTRILGDKCVANRQCKNNNCVNNVCTRNNSTRRSTSNNLNTNMLFGNLGGRNTRKRYK